MQSNTRYFLTIRYGESNIQGNGMPGLTVRTTFLNLFLFSVVILLLITFAGKAPASEQPDKGSDKGLDSRWFPWVGSWRMAPNTFKPTESTVKEQYLLTISPGDNEKSITMKGYRDEEVLSEENIIADGTRHPLTGDKCTGWYMYSWSETGKRLLLRSESSCPGETSRLISGMSVIDDTGEWVDVQLLQNGKEKAFTIRRYRNVDNASMTPGGISANNPAFARISAGSNLSINEIIELSSKVEPEVLEAALMELRKPFPINSKQLEHLADSKVTPEIVDIMVALSFPNEFTVERTTIAPAQRSTAQVGSLLDIDECWDDEYPFFPWYWRSTIYGSCNYWDIGRNVWPGWYYYYWWYPTFGGGGHGIDVGRLIEGRGYARVQPANPASSPRYAQPRNAQAAQERAGRQASGSFSETSSSGSSSVSSSRSSSGSSSKTPCASPNGYSLGDCD
jgi:hypothetical protein